MEPIRDPGGPDPGLGRAPVGTGVELRAGARSERVGAGGLLALLRREVAEFIRDLAPCVGQ